MFADQLLTFLKDWVPTIAVLVGGGWVLFQWLFGESLRRKKRNPGAGREKVCGESTTMMPPGWWSRSRRLGTTAVRSLFRWILKNAGSTSFESLRIFPIAIARL
jgi:hypothetical protein